MLGAGRILLVLREGGFFACPLSWAESLAASFIACKQALLFGRAKQATQERDPPPSRLLSHIYLSQYPQVESSLADYFIHKFVFCW